MQNADNICPNNVSVALDSTLASFIHLNVLMFGKYTYVSCSSRPAGQLFPVIGRLLIEVERTVLTLYHY